MHSVTQAVKDIAAGKMIIVVDDKKRENEGDIVFAAEKTTPELVNFMIKKAGGLICMPMSGELIDKLQLNFMHPDHTLENMSTPFTVSIDARHGITTGISAFERAHTILTAVHPKATASDLITPGHIFPLRAKSNGVLERAGHTEAAVDLARLAGLQPAGVICEIVGEDGHMLRGQALYDFAKTHNLTLVTIEDLIHYRLKHDHTQSGEKLSHSRLKEVAQCALNTHYGIFTFHVFSDSLTQKEHIVLTMGDLAKESKPLVRLHSCCITGDTFHSKHCDCGLQLTQAFEKIAQEKTGIILYLNQEGRGIGLVNKVRAYALQQQGMNTMEANIALGLPVDSRDYSVAAEILTQLKVDDIRLLTNNPQKITQLSELLNRNIERIPLCCDNKTNENSKLMNKYLKAKRDHLGHLLDLG